MSRPFDASQLPVPLCRGPLTPPSFLSLSDTAVLRQPASCLSRSRPFDASQLPVSLCHGRLTPASFQSFSLPRAFDASQLPVSLCVSRPFDASQLSSLSLCHGRDTQRETGSWLASNASGR